MNYSVKKFLKEPKKFKIAKWTKNLFVRDAGEQLYSLGSQPKEGILAICSSLDFTSPKPLNKLYFYKIQPKGASVVLKTVLDLRRFGLDIGQEFFHVMKFHRYKGGSRSLSSLSCFSSQKNSGLFSIVLDRRSCKIVALKLLETKARDPVVLQGLSEGHGLVGVDDLGKIFAIEF